LNTRLKVLASREIARRRSRETFADLLDTWFEQARLIIQNMMRPLAIPTAGGIVSAIVMFGVLAPVLAIPTVSVSAHSEDVPTMLYTGASVKSVQSVAPFGFQELDFVVELTVDGDGRMVDCSIASASNGTSSPAVRRSIENHLLFTQFTPARSFGNPTPAKVRITFRSSRIDVRG
jgi:hypothetical protein